MATPHTEHQKEMPTVQYVKEMSFYVTKPNHVERWAWLNASPATLGAQGRPLPFPHVCVGGTLQLLGSLWALPAIDFLALKCEKGLSSAIDSETQQVACQGRDCADPDSS